MPAQRTGAAWINIENCEVTGINRNASGITGLLTTGGDIATTKPSLCCAGHSSRMAGLAARPNVRFLNRTTVFGACDRGTWGAVERLTANPGRRFWAIHAARTIPASGTLKQPIVHPGIDHTDVMLASAIRGDLHR